MSISQPTPSAPLYIDVINNDLQPEGQLYSEQPGFAPIANHFEIIDERKASQPTKTATINIIPTTPPHSDIEDEPDKILHFQPEGIIKIKPKPSYILIHKKQNINLICKLLHESLGLFKSKSIRIKTFKKVILKTTKIQRQAIRNQYYKIYKITLNKIINKHFNGTMRELFLFSFMTNNELICNNIEYALKYKNMNKLSYILCTLDNNTLKSVQKQFQFKHTSMNHNTKTIKQYIYKITTNLFHQRNIGKYLLKILNCKRRNDTKINMKTVENDTKILYKHLKNATIQNLNKELLMIMFANRSFEHLYYISLKYKQNYNMSLTKTLKNLFKVKSETGYAILLTLNYSINKFIVFGNEFAKDIHINDRNNSAFLRFVMLHYDYDLKNIIEYYGKKAVRSWIKYELKNSDVSDAVLQLCGLH